MMYALNCLKNTGSRNVHALCVLLLLLSTTPVATADLVFYLPCEDAVNPVDASADPTPVAVHGQLNVVEAMIGNGLEFNGIDGVKLEVADADKLDGMSAITIALWFQPRNEADYGLLAKRNNTNNQESYSIFSWLNPTQNVYFRVNGNRGGQQLISSTIPVLNSWYHLAFVFNGEEDGDNMRMYFNGELDASQNNPDTSVVESTPPLTIGSLIPDKWPLDGVIDDVMIFNHALTQDEIQQIMSGPGDPGVALSPKPGNEETLVLPDADLSWKAGKFAASHDVFLGTVAQDVNEATVTNDSTGVYQGNMIVTTFDPGLLAYDQEYFWKVTELNDTEPDSPWEGPLWSFTTEPYLLDLPAEVIDVHASSSTTADSGPENTINGSGLDASGLLHSDIGGMWAAAADGPQPAWIEYRFDKEYLLYEMDVWNHNGILGIFGIKEALIEYSPDGFEYMTLGTQEFKQAPGTPGYAADTTVDFSGIVVNKVKITAQSGYLNASSVGLSEAKFKYLPVRAYDLSLADGTMDVPVDETLNWLKGRQAAAHEICVGMDVHDLPVVDTVSDTGYNLEYNLESADLILGQIYYYKIVEVNELETPARWATDPTGFTVVDSLIVDDMEPYSNEEDARIFYAWVDGYENPAANGALVGADPLLDDYSPETGVVHWGDQSLPIHFDNTTAPMSEATTTFDELENWTRHGITTLSLFVFKGDDNTGGDLYVKINDTKVPLVGKSTYPAGFNPGWVRYDVDLTALDVSNVKSLAVGVEGANAKGVIYVDDIRLYAVAPELPPTVTSIGPLIEAENATSITEPMQAWSDLADASGGAYIAATSGNKSTGNPPTDGIATYTFTVPGGTYQVLGRVIAPAGASDSFWVRIQDAGIEVETHPSGWLLWSIAQKGSTWHWTSVNSWVAGPGRQTVLFTMPAGTYTLELAYRESGTLLDAFAIFAID